MCGTPRGALGVTVFCPLVMFRVTLAASFDVLHLLAHAVDRALDLHNVAADLGVG